MKVKICGMKYPDNILEVSSLYQIIWDLSFGKKSSRYFLVYPYSTRIDKSWCFVNETLLLLSKSIKTRFTSCSIARKESVDFCQELRSQLPKGIEIIKVFSIQDEFDFSALNPSKSSAIIFYLILKENYLEETEQLSIGQY
jgi:phosphoribosylanthranilate isomerase